MLYEKIERELTGILESGHEEHMLRTVKDMRSFFENCQSYLWLDRIRSNKYVTGVLSHYLDREDCLTQPKMKKPRKRGENERLEMKEKLYIEFLWKAYEGKYGDSYGEKTESQFFKTFTQELEEPVVKKTLKDMFRSFDDDTEFYINRVKEAIPKWNEHYWPMHITRLENLHLDSLHKAMEEFHHEACQYPTVAESVEEILTENILKYLLECLKHQNYLGCIFETAAMRAALTMGEPKSCQGRYFNKAYEYNWEQLKNYKEALENQYDLYQDEKEEINKILEKHGYIKENDMSKS